MKRKLSILTLISLCICTAVFAAVYSGKTANAQEASAHLTALRENQGIVYFVNCSKDGETRVENGDKLGLYQTYLDQDYAFDERAGYSWGRNMAAEDYKITKDPSFDKNWSNVYAEPDKDIKYKFELPSGTYNVTLGLMDLSWENRTTKVFINEVDRGNFDILWKKNREFNYSVDLSGVEKNELNLRLSKSDENQGDPYISYIIIREVFENDRYYTAERMYDTEGNVIQAHGGAIYEFGSGLDKKYYWYGEDKTDYVVPYVDDGTMQDIYEIEGVKYGSYSSGVRVYSSTDMYNWTNEGSALKTLLNPEDLDTDEYFTSLYAGATQEHRTEIIRDLHKGSAIIERPKVIYNAKNNNYVMWLHADGPNEFDPDNKLNNWHSYWKASLAVAVSSSPTGPFKYLGLREMHADADHVAWVKANKNEWEWDSEIGGGRDMNLFLDDDGTGYVIYASEGNASLYVSKLNEDFTDVVTTPTDDGSQGLSGVDYMNVMKSKGREAPAVFKYNKKYYMVTSGLTGWNPNPAQYHMADSMFGPWIDMGDPCEGGSSDTFYSQSTFVMPVNPEKGEFFYMGDRWYNPANQGDIDDSRNVWLPIEFDGKGRINIPWRDSWKISDLKKGGILNIRTDIKTQVKLNENYTLPSKIDVAHGEEEPFECDVIWNDYNFNKPGIIEIKGTLTSYDNKEVYHKIAIVPDNSVYFINAGGGLDEDFAMFTKGNPTILNTVQDQEFTGGAAWGYTNSISLQAERGDDIYSSVRLIKKDSVDRNFSYKLTLEKGGYKFYFGFFDPWYQYSQGARKVNIGINGEEIASNVVIGDSKQPVVYSKAIAGGVTDIEFSPSNSGENTDIMISFIIVTKLDVNAISWQTEPADKVFDASAASVKATAESGEITYNYFKKLGNLWQDIGNEAPINVGKYKVVASSAEVDGYISVSEEKLFEITKATYDLSGLSVTDSTFVYDGKPKSIFVVGDIPSGLIVEYDGNGQVNAGTFKVKVIFTGDSNHIAVEKELTATLTITKATLDVSGITFNNLTVTHDGEAKNIFIEGNLPVGVTVEYEGNNQTEAGEYTVTAKFSADSANYEPIPNMTATLKIEKETAGKKGCGAIVMNNNNNNFPFILIPLAIMGFVLLKLRKRATKKVI